MAGTKTGGRRASATNREKYGEDFHKKAGHLGGIAKVPKGFSSNRELASTLAKKIGTRTKVGYTMVYEDKTYRYYEHKKTGEQLRYLKDFTFVPQPGIYRTYSINGVEMGLRALAAHCNIPYVTAHARLRSGWVPFGMDNLNDI